MAKKLVKYIDDKDFLEIVKHLRPRHKLACLFAYGAGLRIAEVIQLKPAAINIEKKEIKVLGKGGKERIVPIPKGFREEYFKDIPFNFGTRALQKAFTQARDKAGLKEKDYSFHSLRHGFAVRCMNQGIPLNIVQNLLGHGNISTTSIYTAVNPKDALKSYYDNF